MASLESSGPSGPVDRNRQKVKKLNDTAIIGREKCGVYHWDHWKSTKKDFLKK